MEKSFWEAIKGRRSFYAINDLSPMDEQELEKIIKQAVKHTPTPFNCQSGRAVLLLGEQHKKVWQFVKEEIKKVAPDSFAATETKIDNSFAAGYATVLYFEDMLAVEDLQKRFPVYKDMFPLWSQQTSGMLQLIVWSALEMRGFGASLQHYNPLIDEKVKKAWDIPDSWQLIAQMPIGTPLAQPDSKEFAPIEQRVKVFA